jgi:hypothetical protein
MILHGLGDEARHRLDLSNLELLGSIAREWE